MKAASVALLCGSLWLLCGDASAFPGIPIAVNQPVQQSTSSSSLQQGARQSPPSSNTRQAPKQHHSPSVKQEAQVKPVPLANVQGVLEQAKNSVINGDDDGARQMLVDKLAELEKQGATSTDIMLMISIIDAAQHRYEEAIKYLRKVQTTRYDTDYQSVREGALLSCRIGDCLYKQGKLKEALKEYYIAVLQAKPLKESDVAKRHILENTVGCLIGMEKYKEAQPLAEELVAGSKACAQDGVPWHLADYLWASLRLGDVYKYSGVTGKQSENSEVVYHLMMRLMNARLQLENQGGLPLIEHIKQLSIVEYVKENAPESIAEEWWLSFENTFKSLPLITWEDPKVTPWAVLICVHGLGLENRAFTMFGHRMASRGIQTCALDVRGFGSWMAETGSERVKFDQCLDDIQRLVRALHKHRPGVPVFVLGESMGGAIVLRAAAELGDSVAGVISSVPSAERFQQRKMSARVAFHFLKGANKPFDIGSQVAEQATSNEEYRKLWEADPKAKIEMTPKELINFALFMRRTKAHVRKIDKTPVMIIQGLSDRLVKPQGSFALFETIPYEDKDLLLLGVREHLIFENAEHPESLLNLVCDWMREHATPPSVTTDIDSTNPVKKSSPAVVPASKAQKSSRKSKSKNESPENKSK